MNKKGIHAVVSLGLLLIVTIVSVITYQGWYYGFESSIFTKIETNDDILNINIDGIYGDSLFIKSEKNYVIKYLRIKNSENDEMCSFKENSESNFQGKTLLVANFNNGTVNSTTVKDLSGNNNHGTRVGTLEVVNNCQYGDCVYLDNVGSDEISFYSLYNTSFPQRKGSLSFWTYGNFSGAFNRNLFDGYATTRNHIFFRKYNPTSNLQVAFQEKDSGYIWVDGQNLNNFGWNNIIITWNTVDDTGSIYLNGVLERTEPITNSTWEPNEQYMNFGSNTIIAYIDEISLYNDTILTSEEVNLLYKSGKALMYEQLLVNDIKDIDISSCSLIKGKKYDVFLLTETETINSEIYVK